MDNLEVPSTVNALQPMCLTWVLSGEAHGQQAVARSTHVASAPGGLQERLRGAARFYEAQGHEQALLTLPNTKALPQSDDERADTLIYARGILPALVQHQKSLVLFGIAATPAPVVTFNYFADSTSDNESEEEHP